MAEYLIAERYAGALSAALSDPDQLDPAAESLAEISELFTEHHDLHSCLSNPAIDVDERQQVMDDVLTKLDVTEPVRRMMHELLRRGRMALLPHIAEAFHSFADERLNRITAQVTTRLPLTAEQELRLRESLSRYCGKTVRMKCSVDESLLGGVVTRLGGEIIDGSLRTRLENIKQALIAEEV